MWQTPTVTRRSWGETISITAPPAVTSRPDTIGLAMAGPVKAASMSCKSAPRVEASHRASPRLFLRAGANILGRRGDGRIRFFGSCGGFLNRIGDDRLNRRFIVREPVNERGIRAVLQQPAHEIGQEIAMAAHRCVNAARLAQRLDGFPVQGLPHAIEALVLVRGVTGQFGNGGDGLGVVGCELRIEAVRSVKERARRREIGPHPYSSSA